MSACGTLIYSAYFLKDPSLEALHIMHIFSHDCHLQLVNFISTVNIKVFRNEKYD